MTIRDVNNTFQIFHFSSVTRLGDFLKFLATIFHAKVAQIIGDVLGYFEKRHFKVTAVVANIWALCETFGLLFTLVTLLMSMDLLVAKPLVRSLLVS